MERSSRFDASEHRASSALPSRYYFKFSNLPTEIATYILVLATTSSAHSWTYRYLTAVSHSMQALVYLACLPHLPIMLKTRRHVQSFCTLLKSHPTTVGPCIRHIWLIADIKASEERLLGHSILQKCTRITHLACSINLLRALLSCSPGTLALKHLTLVEPLIPWGELLQYPAGRQVFTQLTHLRIIGITELVFPDFCFESLTHLSFTCHELAFNATSFAPISDRTRFPALNQIVPSLTYMAWRLLDPKKLYIRGIAIDDRIDVIACPKKWKEADVWERAWYGSGVDLWTSARTGEYLQRSRAFTQEFPMYDFEDADLGGESGL